MNRHYWCIIEISQDRKNDFFQAGWGWHLAARWKINGSKKWKKGVNSGLDEVLVMKVIWDILFFIPDTDKWWYLWFDHNDNDEEYVYEDIKMMMNKNVW